MVWGVIKTMTVIQIVWELRQRARAILCIGLHLVGGGIKLLRDAFLINGTLCGKGVNKIIYTFFFRKHIQW